MPNSPSICASAFLGVGARQVNRHANLAKHPCNTRVILFSPRPSARVAAIALARMLHLTSVLHGTLVPHQVRGDRYLLPTVVRMGGFVLYIAIFGYPVLV